MDILDEVVEEVSRTVKSIGYARPKLPPTPKETLTLRNLEETARLTATSRSTEEPVVDPDEKLSLMLASIPGDGVDGHGCGPGRVLTPRLVPAHWEYRHAGSHCHSAECANHQVERKGFGICPAAEARASMIMDREQEKTQ